MMEVTARETEFERFLEDFATAVELLVSGEAEEAFELLSAAERSALARVTRDPADNGVLAYRYELARRTLQRRHFS